MAEVTPMMRQYLSIKEQHKDCILFFRLGDFYEMFAEDAKLVSGELDLTLTTRDRTKENPEDRIPMCGVPYHSSEAYIARLIAKGYKVAICEQTEDPALAKGLVSREVTRIVTPGTLIDPSMLEEERNNFLCAVYMDESGAGVSFCDLSTGQFSVSLLNERDWRDQLYNELGRYFPREAILSPAAMADGGLYTFLQDKIECRIECFPKRAEQEWGIDQILKDQFGENTARFLPENERSVRFAAGGLLAYLHETQKTDLSHINIVERNSASQQMEMDLTARRNLELTETLRSREKRGSLLWVLDRTKTAMGGRLLREWIERPLRSPVQIDHRLVAVETLHREMVTREELLFAIQEIPDLERLAGRIVYGTANARDVWALAAGLRQIPRIRELLAPLQSALLQEILNSLDDLPEMRELIERAIVEEPPFSVREGGIIREGYHPEVDRLREILNGGASVIAEMETREREKTGIRTLKIGYNKVFGYYIEVSKSYYDLVPETYIRKQTLVNCERFITQELKDLEHTVLSARDKIGELEYSLFMKIRDVISAQIVPLQKTARAVAATDVLLSFAETAVKHGYVRPEINDGNRIQISEGRHPVVERMLKNGLFVPNDTYMDGGENLLSIITGPNMAGKSTYMRQVALIVLMAQIGSFVPAKYANIGVVDRIFTRIGASDDLASGQSTFMVEMREVAEILNSATSKSLLILDEIGRGTSTYDGMSIARAVLEYCANPRKLGARTLFATHYHELTQLENELPNAQNYSIAVKKRGDDLIFLRRIVRGGADRSYGIEAAKLAGVPGSVITRAREILKGLEENRPLSPDGDHFVAPAQEAQTSFDGGKEAAVAARLKEIDAETLTPLEALTLLFELKKML